MELVHNVKVTVLIVIRMDGTWTVGSINFVFQNTYRKKSHYYYYFPVAIAETNIDDDDDDGNNDTFTVCPNDSVNITCQTKSALIWLLSGNILIAYDAISPIGTTEEKEGFAITLLESDGTSFMSVVDTRMNSSFNLSCSPSGVVGDVNNAEIAVTVLGMKQLSCVYSLPFLWKIIVFCVG